MEDEFESVPKQFSFRPPKSKGSVGFSIQGMESVIATVSGYHGTERFKLIKLISHSGASYVGAMNRSTTHLVCWKFEGRKYDLAKQFKIFIVNHRWVEECIKLGRRVPEQPYLFQSGREVGHILLEAPPVAEKVSMLLPHKSNAHGDCKRPAIDIKHGMDGHFIGTHSSMPRENLFSELDASNKHSSELNKKVAKRSSKHDRAARRCYWEPPPSSLLDAENEEPSSLTFMLRARPKRRSTTSAEHPRRGRRLVKKHIMESISSDSEEEGNPTNIHNQYNDLTTPYNIMDGLRGKRRLRIRGTSDDMMYDCGGDRNEVLQDVQQLEDLNDTHALRDSNLQSGEAPTTMERNSQGQCSNVNENLEGTERLARLPTSTDLSCVICWTDFSSSRGVLPCGHRFCFSCIQSWADVMASRSKISTCPLCKASFVSITKVDDAASSDQKIYSQTIPCDPSRMDIFILPHSETPTLGPQPSQAPVCSECCCREPEDLLVSCHLCQIRCIHSYCLDPPLLPWTCIHCKDLRMLYHHIR